MSVSHGLGDLRRCCGNRAARSLTLEVRVLGGDMLEVRVLGGDMLVTRSVGTVRWDAMLVV